MTAHLKTLMLAGAAAFVLALVADVGTAQADRTVTANEPVVWFDDVRGTAKEIGFPDGFDGAGDGDGSGCDSDSGSSSSGSGNTSSNSSSNSSE